MTDSPSFEARILACERCGASLEVGLRGGAVVCGYCGATTLWRSRDAAAASPEQTRTGTAEAEHFERLRTQEEAEAVPPLIAQLMVGGVLNPLKLAEAKREWLRARGECLAGTGAGAADRLYSLTLLWHEHATVRDTDDRLVRAFVESAAELAATPRQAVVLRATLAADAALAGDLTTSAAWLDSCDAEPDDLTSHSALRTARAIFATRAHEPERVLALLGRRVGDVPLAPRDHALAAWLTANALEAIGCVGEASADLAKAIEATGAAWHRFVRAWRRLERLDPCPVCRELVRPRAAWGLGDGTGWSVEFMRLGGLSIAVAVISLMTAIPFESSGDCVFGGLGVAFCVVATLLLALARFIPERRNKVSTTRRVVRGTVIEVEPSADPSSVFRVRTAVESKTPFVFRRMFPARAAGSLEPGALLSVVIDAKGRRGRHRPWVRGAELW